MINDKLARIIYKILIILFVLLSVWWVLLFISGHGDNTPAYIFGATYGTMALISGLYGLRLAKSLGFFKSYFGKAITFLSLGLLFAESGQIVFSFYNIVLGVEVPYPSLADIGFFGVIPAYILGAFYLSKGLNVGGFILKDPLRFIVGMLVPIVVLAVSYWFFLNGYDSSELPILTVLLDLGYPLGQAAFVSIALVTFLFVGKLMGGILHGPIVLLLFAFVLQYIADFNFLNQSYNGTWSNGGYGDYLYLIAYFVMGMSLISLNIGLARAFKKRKFQENKNG